MTTDPEHVDPAGQDDAHPAQAGREAARYRRQLRATEAERDTLRDRLATLQRREAEQAASTRLAAGEDLWRDGATLPDVLDGDGQVDPDRVAAVTTALLAAHPHWAHPVPTPRAAGIGTAGAPPPPRAPGWADVLNAGRPA